MSAPAPPPDARRLARALGDAGIIATVEPRERLAVLVAGAAVAAALADPARRRTAVALARDCGFTHLAIEIAAGDGSPRTDDGAATGAVTAPTREAGAPLPRP